MVALLSPSRPKQRTQWLFVRLRADNSPRLFQFGNRLSPLLSRLIMMTIWFFSGLWFAAYTISLLRTPHGQACTTKHVTSQRRHKGNPKGFAHQFRSPPILVVAPMKSGHNSPVDWASTRGNDIGFWWGGLILPWQEKRAECTYPYVLG